MMWAGTDVVMQEKGDTLMISAIILYVNKMAVIPSSKVKSERLKLSPPVL